MLTVPEPSAVNQHPRCHWCPPQHPRNLSKGKHEGSVGTGYKHRRAVVPILSHCRNNPEKVKTAAQPKCVSRIIGYRTYRSHTNSECAINHRFSPSGKGFFFSYCWLIWGMTCQTERKGTVLVGRGGQIIMVCVKVLEQRLNNIPEQFIS